jgi:hypothetical protein
MKADLTTPAPPAPREFSRYHALCSVHRAAILEAARRMSIGELFNARDSYERRSQVLGFVETVTAHTKAGSIPAYVAAEIFPLVMFHHFEDIDVYSEILSAHSAWVADNLDILGEDELDREVDAFS